MPGAATPTEIHRAHALRARVVKVFPIGTLGGVAYVRAVRGPFPEIPLLPTNGITIETVRDYFAAGVLAVGVGGEIAAPDSVRRRDWEDVRRRAAAFAAAMPVR